MRVRIRVLETSGMTDAALTVALDTLLQNGWTYFGSVGTRILLARDVEPT